MKFLTALFLFAFCFALSNALPAEASYEEIEVPQEVPVPKKRALKGGCSITIDKLGDNPQPLFLQPGAEKQWPLAKSGDMEFESGESMELFCSSVFTNPSGKSGSQTATCVSGVNFKIGKDTFNITEVTCKSWPEFTTRKTGVPCNGGDMYESGFPVGSRFVKQMELCFNEANEVTHYVHHSLSPDNAFYQTNSGRPGFIKGGLFGRKSVDKLYTQKGQTVALEKVIGKHAEMYIEVKETFYLARGHLAAKADFVTANEQRGTFLFANTAPQWQSFNAGNWKMVEDNVRKWVVKKGMNVECYTGIYGVTTLPNEKGVETPIYLDYDKNNNGLIPVPMLYFRVIIEPSTKKGIVLLGVNNPYLSMDQIKKDYILCKDISDKIDFLKLKKDDLKAGYSYACDVNDFAKKNPNLPKFDVKSLLL